MRRDECTRLRTRSPSPAREPMMKTGASMRSVRSHRKNRRPEHSSAVTFTHQKASLQHQAAQTLGRILRARASIDGDDYILLDEWGRVPASGAVLRFESRNLAERELLALPCSGVSVSEAHMLPSPDVQPEFPAPTGTKTFVYTQPKISSLSLYKSKNSEFASASSDSLAVDTIATSALGSMYTAQYVSLGSTGVFNESASALARTRYCSDCFSEPPSFGDFHELSRSSFPRYSSSDSVRSSAFLFARLDPPSLLASNALWPGKNLPRTSCSVEVRVRKCKERATIVEYLKPDDKVPVNEVFDSYMDDASLLANYCKENRLHSLQRSTNVGFVNLTRNLNARLGSIVSDDDRAQRTTLSTAEMDGSFESCSRLPAMLKPDSTPIPGGYIADRRHTRTLPKPKNMRQSGNHTSQILSLQRLSVPDRSRVPQHNARGMLCYTDLKDTAICGVHTDTPYDGVVINVDDTKNEDGDFCLGDAGLLTAPTGSFSSRIFSGSVSRQYIISRNSRPRLHEQPISTIKPYHHLEVMGNDESSMASLSTESDALSLCSRSQSLLFTHADKPMGLLDKLWVIRMLRKRPRRAVRVTELAIERPNMLRH